MEIPAHQLQSPLHRWSSLQQELLWIWDGPVPVESQRHTSDHSHGYWVWLLRKGKVRVDMGNKSWHATAGQWIVSPQGVTHQEVSKDARILSVHFRCQWPTGENLFLGQDAEIWNARDFPNLERNAVALNRLVHKYFPKVWLELTELALDYTVFLKFEQRFMQWLIDFYEVMSQKGRPLAQAGKCDERLLQGMKCLHETPFTMDFPAQQLQQKTGLGRSHLDRLYWKEFGVTTREYWERLRQKDAAHKLQSTSLSVKEIGYHLGFKQASHFTKWFCHRLGMTPTAYRKEPPVKRAI